MLGGDDQAEPFLGERDEGQSVRAGGGLARHAGLGQAGRHRGGDLQVARRLAVIARQVGAVEAEAHALRVEEPAGLGARLAVDYPQAVPGDGVKAGDDGLELGPYGEALTPGGEAHDVGAVGERLAGLRAVSLGVHARDVHEALAREPECRGRATRPPGEGDRRVEQGERGREQRERRVAARHDERRAGRAYRADRDQLKSGVGPVTSGTAARGTVIRGSGRDRGDGDVRRIG